MFKEIIPTVTMPESVGTLVYILCVFPRQTVRVLFQLNVTIPTVTMPESVGTPVTLGVLLRLFLRLRW